MKALNSVFLGLGTNLGNKTKNLDDAESLISEKIGEIVLKSIRIETSPHNFESKNNFLNLVINVKTMLNPNSLLTKCQEIEKIIGRTTKSIDGKYSDRLIDVDILYYNSEIVVSSKLIIPHPKLIERDFVLKPLCQIAPYYIHPLLNKSNFELLNFLTKK